MKKIRAWQCGYCHKCYSRPQSTAIHERACRNNPARRNCKTCVSSYLRRVSTETIDGSQGVPWVRDMAWPTITIHNDVPWCKVHNKAIHEKPYFIECDEYQRHSADVAYHYDYDPDEVYQPIPGTCSNYAYKGYAGWGEPVYPDKEATP